MNVADMERRFFELKGRLDLGMITEADFKTEIEKLRFEDTRGRWWMIGAQSGKWYLFDGVRWLPGQTPTDVEIKPAVSETIMPSEPIPGTQEQPQPSSITQPMEPTPTPSIEPPPASNNLHFEPIVSEPAHDEFTVEPPRDELTPALVFPPSTQESAPQSKEDQVFVAPFTPNALIAPTPLFPSEPIAHEPATSIVSPVSPPPSPRIEEKHADVLPPPAEHLQPTPAITISPEHMTASSLRKNDRSRARLSRASSPSQTKTPKLPVSPLVFIGLAALVAILAVIIFWVAFDNLVPGKPISRLFGLGDTSPRPGTSLPTGVQTALPREISPVLSMGDQLLIQSNIEGAMAQYQNALQLVPNNAASMTRLSRAFAYKGDLPNALAQAQRAIQIAPNDADAGAQFCRMLAWNGQAAEAVVACDSAMRADPKNGAARTALVEAYLFAKRLPDAQTQLPNALQLASQSAETYRVQAWLLTLQGQRPAALDAWRQTIQLEPDFYFRHFEFAEVLRVVFNSPVDAIPEYKKSISLYGGYTPALGRLGIALVAANQSKEAITTLRRAITLEPNNADNYAYLGVAYGKTNQCAQAIPYFEQALKIDPNNAIAQKGLGDCKAGKEPVAPPPTAPVIPLVPPAITR